jgi:hypothetical protein
LKSPKSGQEKGKVTKKKNGKDPVETFAAPIDSDDAELQGGRIHLCDAD